VAQPQELISKKGLIQVSKRGSSPTVREGSVRISGRMKIAQPFKAGFTIQIKEQ
jgi:hypothetical protein